MSLTAAMDDIFERLQRNNGHITPQYSSQTPITTIHPYAKNTTFPHINLETGNNIETSKHTNQIRCIVMRPLSHKDNIIGILNLNPVSPTVTPENRLTRFAFSIITCKPSIVNMNKKGDNGSPCLRPLYTSNSSVGTPLIKTDARALLKQPAIHLLHL
ncbi:hypothetical protein LXL04_016398 [Taraxacum kok-saghyz]